MKMKAPKVTKLPNTPTVYKVDTCNGPAENLKTSGIKIRGTGAATKGLLARGPMA